MDDNATCHRTLAVQDCLDSEGIQRLVWPARSPDLNPIENGMLWGGKLLVETIPRQTRTPSSVHSQRNGINCLNSCWIMLCKDFWHRTVTAGSDVVQSGRPIFDYFFQHLWPYIGNNTANVVFQMVKRLWLIRIDQ
ncbi:adhesion G protein-coupled receptor B2 [Trichonephila clavipes]|nr:adhesion G protein-coupled receptor B2 [Trichonephila clavipes]